MKRAFLIYRAHRFSPNSVDVDKLILEEVGRCLSNIVDDVTFMSEDCLCETTIEISTNDFIFSMARSEQALCRLREFENKGIIIINSPKSVVNCCRPKLFEMLRLRGINVPLSTGERGFWLKRGDQSAQSVDDIVYCKTQNDLSKAIKNFESRAITDYVVQSHIEGDLLKFYGVYGTDFFRYYYPTDDGISKFNHEYVNGAASHYHFNKSRLYNECCLISEITGVKIYGGDAIVTSEGQCFFIDFNDWPSFRRCRNEAAVAIVQLCK